MKPTLLFLRLLCLPASLFAGSVAWTHAGSTPQSLTWTAPATDTVMLLNQPSSLTASTSSGLPVTFRVQSGPAVVSGGAVTATNVGTIVVVAEQVGDGTYASVSSIRMFNRSRVVLSRLGAWPGWSRGDAEAVFVAGSRAYVALGAAGLAIFDISDPVNIA